MQVNVRLYGTLRRLSISGKPGFWQGDLPAGSKVIDLINAIGSNTSEVAAASLNGVVCGFDTEIPPGAELILVTHMGAG